MGRALEVLNPLGQAHQGLEVAAAQQVPVHPHVGGIPDLRGDDQGEGKVLFIGLQAGAELAGGFQGCHQALQLLLLTQALFGDQLIIQEKLHDLLGQAPFFEAAQIFLIGDNLFQGLEQRFALQGAAGPQAQALLLHAPLQQIFLELAVILQVGLFRTPGEAVQGRLGDVEVAAFHQRGELPVEEGEQQGADMGPVHVGISHDDDLVVAQGLHVDYFLGEVGAQGGDQGADLGVLQHLLEAGLFHVDDLALEGQDGLEAPVPGLLGRAAGRVALHQVDLPFGGVPLLAVGQLARQGHVAHGAFLAHQVPGPPGRLPGPGRVQQLGQDVSGHPGIFAQVGQQVLVQQVFHQALDLAVAQLGLGLAFELGVRQLDADHRDQALPDVFPGQVAVLQIFGQVADRHVLVDGPGEAGLEAAQVRAPFPGVDVVGEGEDLLVVSLVVLEGDFQLEAVLAAGQKNRVRIDGGLVAVQIFDKGDDAAFVMKFVFAPG